MPRVVPSQIVDFINTRWPSADQQKHVGRAQAGHLTGLVDLADQVPGELLTMESALYALFLSAKGHIRHRLVYWATSDPNRGHDLGVMSGQPEQVPVTVIRDALARCPDESPESATSELTFITDPDLRTNLRIDVGAVTRALSNGEWKAATVLAGSAAEALLLWALKQRLLPDITSAIATARASGELSSKPDPNDLDRWNLHEYTEVAAKLKIIKPQTAEQTRLARHFRNFIHPGVALRYSEKCDRATALSAVAGMEHVVRDLTP
ncbi:MAG TPA: hypothetical protein VGR03_02000 [Candidatus Acidoferrum sp.]|nr:hypothetical protein [Candidatus Acidoferrum sp.]